MVTRRCRRWAAKVWRACRHEQGGCGLRHEVRRWGADEVQSNGRKDGCGGGGEGGEGGGQRWRWWWWRGGRQRVQVKATEKTQGQFRLPTYAAHTHAARALLGADGGQGR